MSLYRYFSKVKPDPDLPDPSGPLSKEVPSSSIAAANSKVSAVMLEQVQESEKETKSRGKYAKFSAEKKAEVERRASEHGIASTIRYYAKDSLKESTVRTWRNVCC